MKLPFLDQQDWILDATGAHSLRWGECVQSLWSGYGEIRRIFLEGAETNSVILKAVALPDEVNHPRGWHSDLSHQRKVRSYAVEMHWYREWAESCADNSRVAHCYGAGSRDNGAVILLEDLDAAGFTGRRDHLENDEEIFACLHWLAALHGRFLLASPTGLWPVGTYWHLQTRPDEWQVMADGALKQAAGAIDKRLNESRFHTLVHGDAKVANFCFHPGSGAVASVDFQYVGAGCGMKDVAYFLGSCLDTQALDGSEARYLDGYFAALRAALSESIDAEAVEAEWRALYPFAWADFHRFLEGWMPSHHKINPVMERWTRRALAAL